MICIFETLNLITNTSATWNLIGHRLLENPMLCNQDEIVVICNSTCCLCSGFIRRVAVVAIASVVVN